jgi:DNA-binding response OmpR family regulator
LVVTPARATFSIQEHEGSRASALARRLLMLECMTDDAPDTIRCPPSFGDESVEVGASILLVEDDEPLARCLLRMMKADGYQVVHAPTGVAAIENVRSRSFDVVLSDLNLPDSCGVDILRIAREHDPDVPLLLMSGDPRVETTIEAMNMGVLEYMVKPLTNDQLMRVLRRATSVRTEQCRRLLGAAPIVQLWPEFEEIDRKH